MNNSKVYYTAINSLHAPKLPDDKQEILMCRIKKFSQEEMDDKLPCGWLGYCIGL
jgi:hypothetical protein